MSGARQNLPPDEDPDAGLMMQVAAGSETAFVELIHRHQNFLLNFFRRLGAYSDAEDLVQDTFLRLYRYRERYRASARFTTFLYVLARHAWADRGRKIVRRERLASRLEIAAEVAAENPPPAAGGPVDVEAAMSRLSPKLRQVLVLNVYQGMRYQEVADVLGIPLGTVKSRINLAMQELRRYFGET